MKRPSYRIWLWPFMLGMVLGAYIMLLLHSGVVK